MYGARWLTHLLFASLLLSATLAHAQEPPASTQGEHHESIEATPPDKSEAGAAPADENGYENGPTWFGMGFESRQDRFRRDMGIPSGGAPGGGGGSGGRGNGFGR